MTVEHQDTYTHAVCGLGQSLQPMCAAHYTMFSPDVYTDIAAAEAT